jgi:hypothetical protein
MAEVKARLEAAFLAPLRNASWQRCTARACAAG